MNVNRDAEKVGLFNYSDKGRDHVMLDSNHIKVSNPMLDS